MTNRTLSGEDFEHGPARKELSHLQYEGKIEGKRQERVDEAMKAAIAHVEKTQGLQYGMQGKHIGKAMDFIDKNYKSHQLAPAERDFIEKSFKSYLKPKETSEEAPREE